MKQTALLEGAPTKALVEMDDDASVVALDRQDEEAIVLRFLMDGVSWNGKARQVRLSKSLAEQLLQMLSDELEDSSERFHYRYA